MKRTTSICKVCIIDLLSANVACRKFTNEKTFFLIAANVYPKLFRRDEVIRYRIELHPLHKNFHHIENSMSYNMKI